MKPTPLKPDRARTALRVLLHDDDEGLIHQLKAELERAGHVVVGTCASARELADNVERLAPDIVMLAVESPTRDTMEQVVVMSERTPRPIVLLTPDDSPQTMRRAIQAGISAYVVADTPLERVETVLDLAVARFEEDQRLRAALREAEDQLADRKLIERAKGLLMESRHCAEDEAYRLMRRMAMDRNLRLRDLAEQLIAAQSLLRG